MGAEDANRLLSSASTTVITTEARAAGHTHVEGATVNLGTPAQTVQTQSSSSSTSHPAQSAHSAATAH